MKVLTECMEVADQSGETYKASWDHKIDWWPWLIAGYSQQNEMGHLPNATLPGKNEKWYNELELWTFEIE